MDWPSNGPRLHPAAKLFPLMDKDALTALRKDILANGVTKPLLYTPMGELIDGRNRWLACRNIAVPFPQHTFTGNAYSYVVAQKLGQSSFTRAQRIILGARLFEMPLADGAMAKPRHQDICEWFDIASSPFQRGRRILKNGIPELIKLVEEGNIPITPVERVSQLTSAEQKRYVTLVRSGEDPVAVAPEGPDYHADRHANADRERSTSRQGRHYAPPRTAPTPAQPKPPMPNVTLKHVASTLAAVDQQLQRCGDIDSTIPLAELVAWSKDMRWGIAALNKLRKRVQARIDAIGTEAN